MKDFLFDPNVHPITGERITRRKRGFSQTQKAEILHRQGNKCAICGKELDPRTTQFHHKRQYSDEGETKTSNGIAVHPNCHAEVHHKKRLKKQEIKTKESDKGPFYYEPSGGFFKF